MRTRLHLRIALVVASCLSLALPVLGQSEPRETFEDSTRVVEVLVPVHAVDAEGRPIRGLTADQFTVKERGKRREISSFQEIDLESMRTAPGKVSSKQIVPSMARRHFLLVFDLSFSNPATIMAAREHAIDFILGSLHPTDLVAVLAFSMQRGLQLQVTFTPDRAQVARAIDVLATQGLVDYASSPDPLRFVVGTPVASAEAGAALGGQLAEQDVGKPDNDLYYEVVGREMDRYERSAESGKMSVWAKGLSGLAQMLREVQGQKHVVYFSEGIDGRFLWGGGGAGQMERDRLESELGRQVMTDASEQYGDTTLLNAVTRALAEIERTGSVIQTIDISALGGESTERSRGRAGQDVLFYLARETGGTLSANRTDLQSMLDELLQSSSVTYLIGFRADDLETDGSYHKIDVKAELPRGAELIHRGGYYAPKPFAELDPFERSLLAADAIAAGAPISDVGLDVLAAPFRAGARLAYVPVILEIDGRSLLLEQRTDALPVEIYAYVTDAQNEIQDFFTQRLTLDLDQARDALAAGGVKYYGHVDLTPGEYLVRVLVRNGETGRGGVTTVPLAIPGYAEGDPAVVGPFFMETPGRWLMVREPAEMGADSVVYPFTVSGEAYVPAARPELPPSTPTELCLVGYHLADPDLEIATRVVDADGTEVGTGQLEITEWTVTGIAGYDKALATYEPPALEPGEYRLEISLTDRSGVRRLETAAAFRVPG